MDYTCGNFPEYRVDEHVGNCYSPCPFDIDAPELRTRHLLGISISGTLPLRVAHIGSDNKHYYMKTTNNGDWGYICTFSGCTYLIDNGVSFFYR
jgi:hypothetical protein